MHPPIILTNSALPRLFCKPENADDFIYYSPKAHGAHHISFKSLDIDKELPSIHLWVNKQYTARFWQMDGPYGPFKNVYQKIVAHPNAHSFTGHYNGKMVCQFDVYMLGVDELSYHLPDESNYCGFHLLMSPNDKPIRGLTVAVINSFLHYYFSFAEGEKMYAEPDIENEKSIHLLQQCGFQFLETLKMSYKTAHLYCLTRQHFLSH